VELVYYPSTVFYINTKYSYRKVERQNASLKIWLFSFYVPTSSFFHIIPNSAVGIFSPKTQGTMTKAARVY
jgi:hypothetical protein